MGEPTMLELLLAYVEVFITLFAAAGNSLIGIVATVVGVVLTLLQDAGVTP